MQGKKCRRRAFGAWVLAIAACPAWAADRYAPTISMRLAPTNTELTFIEGQDATRLLAIARPAGAAPDGIPERELVAICANGEPQRTSGEKGFATKLATAAWQVILAETAERVRRELARYSTVSEQTARIDYYRGGSSQPAGARLQSRYSCLRFTRWAIGATGEPELALDFVASIGLDSDGEALLLRPLRLYVNRVTALSATARYGIAISLRANAVWREDSQGHEGQVFQRQVVRTPVDLGTGAALVYYPTDAATGQRLPIVPVSSDADRSRDFGRVDMTVSVAESGVPPTALRLLARLLPESPDHRTRLLFDAALTAIPGAD